MKTVNLLAVLAISFSSFSFVGCTNSEEFVGTDASIAAAASDEAQASSVSDQIISTADDFVNESELSGFQSVSPMQKMKGAATSDSVILIIDKTGLTGFPKRITVDFGTSGYTDKRGNILKGKLFITVSNSMSIAGSTRTIEFSNFQVNDKVANGSNTLTYNGDADGFPSWTVISKDTITRNDGKVVIWNANLTRTRIGTNNTPLIYWDDIYTITGSTNGVNANAVAYTMEIVADKPLRYEGGFKHFVSGDVIISAEKRTALLDYGNGEKDAIATVTIDGKTKEIKL